MATDRQKVTAKVNHAEFKALHNKLSKRYLQKHLAKANQVVMKDEAQDTVSKNQRLQEAIRNADMEAAAAAKAEESKAAKVEQTKPKSTVKASYGVNTQQVNKQNKDKKQTYDPVEILSNIEAEEKNAENTEKDNKVGVLNTITSFMSSVLAKNYKEIVYKKAIKIIKGK